MTEPLKGLQKEAHSDSAVARSNCLGRNPEIWMKLLKEQAIRVALCKSSYLASDKRVVVSAEKDLMQSKAWEVVGMLGTL